MSETRLPSNDNRTIVIGRTGSGKTQFSVWLLSTRDWDSRVWMVLDFKYEKLFAELGLTPWDISAPLPEIPGIYWVRPIPGSDVEVSEFFRRCYERGNIGIYTDEGTMLPQPRSKLGNWVAACLTQGRSKRIEMITCTQRPANISVEFFTEASFMSIFDIRHKDDQKRISDYTDGLTWERLPEYYSLWYDVVNDSAVILEPVPPPAQLVENFLAQIEEAEEIRDEKGDEKGIIPL